MGAMIVMTLTVGIGIWVCGQKIDNTTAQQWEGIAAAETALASCVGLLTLVIYTRETFLLRKVAEAQNEALVMPVVIPRFSLKDSQPHDTSQLDAKNIGQGPAFNVCILPISWNGLKVVFEEIAMIESGAQSPAPFLISQESEYGGYARQPVLLAQLIKRPEFPPQTVVVIECRSLSGERYRTIHQIHYATNEPLRIEFVTIQQL